MYKLIASSENIKKQALIEQMLMDFYHDPETSSFGQWLLGQLKTIVRSVGMGKISDVRWGNYGGGSFQDPNNHRITFDPAMIPFDAANLDKNIKNMYFVAGHEEIHDVITKYTDFINEMLDSKQIEDGIEVLGLSTLGNAIEDPKDNDCLKDLFPGFKTWVKDFYDPMFTQENTDLFGQPVLLEQMKQVLGYVPKFIKYTSEIIRFWHTGKFSSKLEPEVQSLLDRTKDAFVRAYEERPKEYYEDEIYRSARASFEIVIKEIWDGKNGYKEMLEDARKLEESRQMMMDEDTQQQVLDQLTSDQLQELLEQINDAMQQQQSQQGQQGQQGQQMTGGGGSGADQSDEDASSQDGGSSGSDAGKTGKNQGKQNQQPGGTGESVQNDQTEEEDGQGAGESAGKAGQNQDEQNQQPGDQDPATNDKAAIPKDWNGQLDMDKLSPEIKEKLEKAKQNLDKTKKEEIENKAKEQIKKATKEVQAASKSKFKQQSQDGKPQADQQLQSSDNSQQGGSGSDEFSFDEEAWVQKMEEKSNQALANQNASGKEACNDKDNNVNTDNTVNNPITQENRNDLTAQDEQDKLTPEELQDLKDKGEALSRTLNNITDEVHISLNAFEAVNTFYSDDISTFVNLMGQALEKNDDNEVEYGLDTGPYVSMDLAMQMEANPSQYKVFGDRDLPQGYDYAFHQVVDISASMDEPADKDGSKIDHAFNGVSKIIWGLQRMGIKNALTVFNYSPRTLKDYEEDLRDETRKRLSAILHMCSGGTNDATAIEYCYDSLKARTEYFKFLTVITDGDSGQPTELSRLMFGLAKEGLLPLPVAFGIGSATSGITGNYPISIGCLEPTDFNMLYPAVIKDILDNPYYYTGEQVFTQPNPIIRVAENIGLDLRNNNSLK